MSASQRDNLALLVTLLHCLHRGDFEQVAQCLAPDVTWRGVVPDAVCHDREEVLEMLRESVREGLPHAEALELVATERAVVLGVRSPDLREIAELALPRQLYNVFFLRDGRIVAVEDRVHRDEALRAAGARAPAWRDAPIKNRRPAVRNRLTRRWRQG